MSNILSQKIARDIAHTSFGYVVDCISGLGDMDYNLDTSADEFEQNFEEDLEERKIKVTAGKINIIKKEYDKMIDKCKKSIDKIYKSYLPKP